MIKSPIFVSRQRNIASCIHHLLFMFRNLSFQIYFKVYRQKDQVVSSKSNATVIELYSLKDY